MFAIGNVAVVDAAVGVVAIIINGSTASVDALVTTIVGFVVNTVDDVIDSNERMMSLVESAFNSRRSVAPSPAKASLAAASVATFIAPTLSMTLLLALPLRLSLPAPSTSGQVSGTSVVRPVDEAPLDDAAAVVDADTDVVVKFVEAIVVTVVVLDTVAVDVAEADANDDANDDDDDDDIGASIASNCSVQENVGANLALSHASSRSCLLNVSVFVTVRAATVCVLTRSTQRYRRHRKKNHRVSIVHNRNNNKKSDKPESTNIVWNCKWNISMRELKNQSTTNKKKTNTK